MKKLSYSIAAALIIAPTFALAKDDHHQKGNLQYTGPVETTSITELLKDTSMFTEQEVVIDGRIVRQIVVLLTLQSMVLSSLCRHPIRPVFLPHHR